MMSVPPTMIIVMMAMAIVLNMYIEHLLYPYRIDIGQ
jgi:hypothetical protein